MNKLTKLMLKNFQSLKDADLPIGNFTVILGPSNLGKSAILRALKALARNASAPGLVRQGEKEFDIAVSFSDGLTERLVKGSKVSQFSLERDTQEPTVFAKAGASSVPEQIAEVWSIPDFCFTTQHDRPFLLAEAPSEVAKTLGELTNAALLMEAVREANRQRSEALAEVKARSREVDEARTEILKHKGLTLRGSALAEARKHLDRAKVLEQKRVSLEQVISFRSKVCTALSEAETSLAELPDVTQPLAQAESLAVQLRTLKQLSVNLVEVENKLSNAHEVAANTVIARAEIEANIHDLISEAGQCPLCGQGTV